MINGTGPYQTGISDLQVLLNDQANDKYNFMQRCFGPINGTNTLFKTFFRRRSTNFTVAGSGGVYINEVLVPASGVSSDNVETGEFILATAPTDGSIVEASYFNQWFDVFEIDMFLQTASLWESGQPDYTMTAGPLVPPLLKYAAAEGYLKMANRWRTYMSQEYKVEDAPKDSPTYNTDSFLKLAAQYKKEALDSRTEYYQTRSGRALQPLFGRIRGRIRTLP